MSRTQKGLLLLSAAIGICGLAIGLAFYFQGHSGSPSSPSPQWTVKKRGGGMPVTVVPVTDIRLPQGQDLEQAWQQVLAQMVQDPETTALLKKLFGGAEIELKLLDPEQVKDEHVTPERPPPGEPRVFLGLAAPPATRKWLRPGSFRSDPPPAGEAQTYTLCLEVGLDHAYCSRGVPEDLILLNVIVLALNDHGLRRKNGCYVRRGDAIELYSQPLEFRSADLRREVDAEIEKHLSRLPSSDRR